MTKIYACLLGNWVCLNDDPDCKMGYENLSPEMWWIEGGANEIPFDPQISNPHAGEHSHIIDIYYRKKDYKIDMMFLQIVEE